MRAIRRALGALTSALVLSAALPLAGAGADTAPSGPDVSSWQHYGGVGIDWTKVRAAGNSFAIVKATDGASYVNPWFAGDRQAASAAQLAVGAYAFVQPALPISTATTQAQHFAAAIGAQQTAGTLPPVMDLEISNGLSPSDLITWSQQFLETVRSLTGRTPVVYSYPYFWSDSMAGTTALHRYPLWLAAYGRTTPPAPLPGWPAWSLWQYSSTSSVVGISGQVDMSRFAGANAALTSFADGRISTAWPVTAPSAPQSVVARPRLAAADVTWRPADDGGKLPSSYTVTASPGGARTVVSGTLSSATVTGLAPGAAYTFTVRATNSAGTSPSSPSSATVVTGQLPGIPGAPTATPGTASVSLRWPAATGSPSRYLVHRCSTSGCAPATVVLAIAYGTSYVDRQLVNGTRYTYSVSAVNDFGTSPNSSSASAVPVAPPSAPTSLAASGTANSVTLGWAPPASTGGSAITSYAVVVDGAAPVALSATTRTFTRTGLTAGSSHALTVRAGNSAGNGPTAGVTATASGLAPATVSLALRVTLPSSGELLPVVVGAVRTDTGAPLPGRPVTVTFRPAAGAAPAPLHLLTGSTGSVTALLRPVVNGTVTAVLGATSTSSAATQAVPLQVRPVLTAVLSATTTLRGHSVVLTGATSPLLAGERVYRQGYYSGAWHTWASTLIDTTGHYRLVITPTVATVNHYRLWLDASWLHVSGASRTVDLLVS